MNRSWFEFVPIDRIASALALIGTISYGVLFIAYRLYFAELGLQPEDSGVSNAFIAPRAVGMGLLCALIAVSLGILLFYFISPRVKVIPSAAPVLKTVAGLSGGALIFLLISQTLPGLPKATRFVVAVGVIIMGYIYGLWLSRPGHLGGPSAQAALRASAIIAALAAFLFPVVSLCVRADAMGKEVNRGRVCGPIEFFGLPLLDVTARNVTVNWVGKDWPVTVFGLGTSPQSVTALLLARDTSTLTILTRADGAINIVRLDAASVTLRYPASSSKPGRLADCVVDES